MTLKNDVFHAIQNWYMSNFGVVYTSSKKTKLLNQCKSTTIPLGISNFITALLLHKAFRNITQVLPNFITDLEIYIFVWSTETSFSPTLG